ncbi:MAG: hypothetical protein AB7E62_10890, partial [Methanothrix sp.]
MDSELLQSLLIAFERPMVEADGYCITRVFVLQIAPHLPDSNTAGPLYGKALSPCAFGRFGYALYFVLLCQGKAALIA